MPTYTNEELKQRAGAPLLDSPNQPSSSVQLNADELKLDRLEQLRSKRPLSKRALPKLVLSSILLSPILLGGLWFMGGMKFPTFSSTQPDEANKNELAINAEQKKLLDKIDEQQKQIAETEAKLASFNQQKKEPSRDQSAKSALNTKTQKSQQTQRRVRQPSSSVAVRQTPRVRSVSQSRVVPTQRVVTQPYSRRTLSSRPVKVARRPPIQPTFRPRTVPTLNSASTVVWEPNKGVSGGAVLVAMVKQARPDQNIEAEIQDTQNIAEETSKINLEDSLLSERPLIEIEQGTIANGILSAGLSWDLEEEIIGQTVSIFLEEPILRDGQVVVEVGTEIIAQVVKASQSGLIQLVGVKIGAASSSIPLVSGAITFLATTGKPLIAQAINNDGGEDNRPDWLNAILAEGLAAANPRQVIRVNGGDDDILSRLLMGGAQGLVDNLTLRRRDSRYSRSTQTPLFYLEANTPVKIVFLKNVNFLSDEDETDSKELDLSDADKTDSQNIYPTKENSIDLFEEKEIDEE